jgi:OOP family OmpA-OmpF porin
MKMRNRISRALILGAGLAAAPAAFSAVPAAWYVGAGVGQSNADDSVTIRSQSVKVDDTDTAWKVFGGYRFNPNFGLELGWVDLGKLAGNNAVDYELKGATLEAVGTIPLADNFDVFAKIGGFSWDSDASGAISKSDSGTDTTGGVGVGYHVNDRFGVRLEWERFDSDLQTDMYSVSATLGF